MKMEGKKKPTGQRHIKKKGGDSGPAKGTMGTGKVEPKARGAMGKHQETGTGGA